MSRLDWAQSLTRPRRWALLGTQDGEGVYRARWDAATGTLGSAELAAKTPRPSYIALHPNLPVLYACNEHEGAAAGVSAFRIEPVDATLAPLSASAPMQRTDGDDPCYVSVDRTGRLLFTANYGGGSLSVFPLNPAGAPGAMLHQFSCKASQACGSLGPQHDRQDVPHLHCATVSPNNHFVLACDLGDDAILVFPLRPGSGTPVGQPVRLPARPGSGPRHIAFHPADPALFYCIHELDCTVDAYRAPTAEALIHARLVPGSVLTLAHPSNDPALPNTGAELAVSPDGRFLYTSVRGVDQLTVAAIHPGSRENFEVVQQLPCGGKKPRFFALDPSGKWLLCANQDSRDITVFARDTKTGRLTPHGQQTSPSPMCIVWV